MSAFVVASDAIDGIRCPPFLKWAGGKRWLVEQHSNLFPGSWSRFIEPFVGSGAVFFGLTPARAILADKNERLIESYRAIRDNWLEVSQLLRHHQNKHCSAYYYEMRAKKLRKPESRAAQFIYLNRTCWNGLYRVNKKGEFNVPVGTKQNVVLAADDFEEVSRRLQKADLIAGDFELAMNQACKGDFVFVDPPYTVKHNLNGFVKYNEHIFSWEDQLRLRESVKNAKARGAYVFVTNAYHDSIVRLYEDIGEIQVLNRASVISGKASARGRYEEVVIKCFNG
ncbi:DNA adenine methylase [Hydrogenophaga pseudoflava]|uniref:DNA adenine methylase n=1 Tax=Hydrogenophaga pseudoflava TaxID=47421 RepID=UPI000A05F0A8|nr:Dam family site-specific DNA-(adenine-N6)-methyltransferase [Hydrogenophaga pseudoflava]